MSLPSFAVRSPSRESDLSLSSTYGDGVNVSIKKVDERVV
jgi:hypothetical protein